MKITGTRSYIKVEIGERTLIIQGELTTTPAFYADINSIKKWEPPFENDIIDENEKNEIIKKILKENENNSFKVFFD